jgi:hypothetical protein
VLEGDNGPAVGSEQLGEGAERDGLVFEIVQCQ